MKERIIKFGENNNLIGILTESENYSLTSSTVIMLNSGMVYRIGPNRMYVELARSLAGIGYNSFRLDFSGIGDSEVVDNDLSFEENACNETIQAMDTVTHITGCKKYILLGICSGAEIAYKTSLKLENIIGIIIVNGNYISSEILNTLYPIAKRRTSIRYYKKQALNISTWLKVLKGNSNIINKNRIKSIKNIYKRLLSKNNSKNIKENRSIEQLKQLDPFIENIEYLLKKNIFVFQVYSEGSTSYDIFNLYTLNKISSLLNYKGYILKTINNADHTFTPVWSQKLLNSFIMNNIK